jgi:hypothetical protein
LPGFALKRLNLQNGGLLEHAQMAAHESARTTKLYDRRSDEVEKIML